VSKNEKFRAMFTGQMMEATKPEIKIEEVNPNIFKVSYIEVVSILQSTYPIYTSSIESI
jgi:hypothetical protein